MLVKENLAFRGLGKRRKMNIIKRGVLLFIATRLLPDSRYQELTQLFQTFDLDGDGSITWDEIKAGYVSIAGDNKKLLRDLDKMCYLFAEEGPGTVGGNGRLNFIQFVAAIVELKGEVDDQVIG